MTVHSMKLLNYIFEEVKEETKLIEIRLFDEKRQKVNLWDIIRFSKLPDLKETLDVKVLQIKTYKTWKDLVDDTPLNLFGPRWKSKEDLYNAKSRYTLEEQNKYGFVVFYIKLITFPKF